MNRYRGVPYSCQKGVSLIELMVALLIGILISFGIVQIFGASRATYQMQEGLSRVQESGRFAVQYLEHQLRMVGYMGCGSDTERTSQASFVNHLATYSASVPGGDVVANPIYRFQRPLEGFAAGDPAIPTQLGIVGAVAGTDILVVRVLGEDSVPVVSVARRAGDPRTLDITVADGAADVLSGAAGSSILYGLQSCRSADVFAGTLGAGALLSSQGAVLPNVYLDPAVTDCAPGGNCPWDFRISNAFLNAPAGTGGLQLNAEIHRAEYLALYVKNNPGGIPSLYMRRFERGSAALEAEQELAEGVEKLLIKYGVDSDGNGQVDTYQTAAEVAAGAAGATLDANWRKVLSVRVGMLLLSPEVAGVSGELGGVPRKYTVLDTSVTPPDDHKLRQVYEATIALRNRIFNS